MYAVMAISTKQRVRLKLCQPPLEEEISMSFAAGMIGVLPVFDTKEDAEKYADGAEVISIEKP